MLFQVVRYYNNLPPLPDDNNMIMLPPSADMSL
jgi:hypothetical protein